MCVDFVGGQVAGKVFELLLNDVDPDDPEPQEWLMFTKVENKDYLIKGIWQKDENFSVHVRSVADESSSTYEVCCDSRRAFFGRCFCLRSRHYFAYYYGSKACSTGFMAAQPFRDTLRIFIICKRMPGFSSACDFLKDKLCRHVMCVCVSALQL